MEGKKVGERTRGEERKKENEKWDAGKDRRQRGEMEESKRQENRGGKGKRKRRMRENI